MSGWEPESHITGTIGPWPVNLKITREPEWDDIDHAMVDLYLNHQADLHSCGRPLSESLKDFDDPQQPDPHYQVGTETCRACMALDKRHAERAASDADLVKEGRHPDSWRIDTVLPIWELPEADREAALAAEAARGKQPKPQ